MRSTVDRSPPMPPERGDLSPACDAARGHWAAQWAAQRAARPPVDSAFLPGWARAAPWIALAGLLSIILGLVAELVWLLRAGVFDIRGLLWTALLLPVWIQSVPLMILLYGGAALVVVAVVVSVI